MARPARLRRDFLTAAGTAAAAVLLYPRALLRGESFFERDLLVDWYQRTEVLRRCLREHAWPLWDPTIGFGYPLLADPGSQVLYPPAWLAFVLPPAIGYTAFAIGHLLLGSLGMRRLASALGAGAPGAATAAWVWALSGPMQSTVNLRHHFAAAAWLPWLLLLTERVLRRPCWRYAVGLACAAALQFLAGSPDLTALSGVALLGWALVRALRRRPKWQVVPAIAAATLVSAGLTAALWWPALDVLSRSARLAMPEHVRVHWSLPPLGLLRLLAPLDPGHVPFAAGPWTRLFDAAEQPFLASVYLGAPALLAAAAALARPPRSRGAQGVLVLALIGIGYAMGPHGPVYGPATSGLGFLRLLRYPSKAMLAATPFVALLAGLGVSRLRRQGLTPVSAVALAALGCALAAGAAGSGLAFGGSGSWPVTAGLVAIVGLLMAACVSGRVPSRTLAWLLPALCAIDLVAAHAELNATAPLATLLATPPTVALVDRSEARRLYVYDYHSLRGTAEQLLGRASAYLAFPAPGIDRRLWQVLAQRLYLPPPLAGLYGLENSYDIDLRGLYPAELHELTLGLRQLEGTPAHLKLLRMGAVGTVFSMHRRGLEDLHLERVVPTLFADPLYVWQVPAARPRSWLVGCARAAAGDAAPRALTDPGFEPSAEVVLPEAAAESAPSCGEAGSSRLLALHPDRVRLEVQASRAAFLVLADAYDPGWTASVDGRPAPLLRANVAFRAVPVPAGAHEVEMVYRPAAVRRGLILTAGTLAALAGLIVVGRRRDQSRTRRLVGAGPSVIDSAGA